VGADLFLVLLGEAKDHLEVCSTFGPFDVGGGPMEIWAVTGCP
jgi:hypothetical protein